MKTEYVRLTFRPSGARRSRTVWATVVRRRPDGIVCYRQVKSNGDDYSYERRDGVEIDEVRLILARPDGRDAIERPARMSLHYGELEIVA